MSTGIPPQQDIRYEIAKNLDYRGIIQLCSSSKEYQEMCAQDPRIQKLIETKISAEYTESLDRYNRVSTELLNRADSVAQDVFERDIVIGTRNGEIVINFNPERLRILEYLIRPRPSILADFGAETVGDGVYELELAKEQFFNGSAEDVESKFRAASKHLTEEVLYRAYSSIDPDVRRYIDNRGVIIDRIMESLFVNKRRRVVQLPGGSYVELIPGQNTIDIREYHNKRSRQSPLFDFDDRFTETKDDIFSVYSRTGSIAGANLDRYKSMYLNDKDDGTAGYETYLDIMAVLLASYDLLA